MTNLPATLDEEEAIAAVAGWVDVVREKMSAEASRECLEGLACEYLRHGWSETIKVIDAAKDGDEIAHAALVRVFAEMLDRGEMPPAALRAYGELAAVRGPVKRSAGRNSWADNWRRDAGIAVLAYFAKEKFKLRPTRNRESKKRNRKPSACSVVAAALGRARIITITERRVENIWAGLAGQVAAFVVAQKMSTPIPPN
jgi:hypothetical protein